MSIRTTKEVPPLEDCSGCTDRNSEGTHQGHTKQHGCVGCLHNELDGRHSVQSKTMSDCCKSGYVTYPETADSYCNICNRSCRVVVELTQVNLNEKIMVSLEPMKKKIEEILSKPWPENPKGEPLKKPVISNKERELARKMLEEIIEEVAHMKIYSGGTAQRTRKDIVTHLQFLLKNLGE